MFLIKENQWNSSAIIHQINKTLNIHIKNEYFT